jgi:uncharacterized protein (TIGR03067 family)
VLRIVPKIDMTGFAHKIVDRRIVLRGGVLAEGATSWDDERRRDDPRPAPTPAMIAEATQADRKRLQGEWSLVSVRFGGNQYNAAANTRWTVRGDRIVMELSDRREATFTLDLSKSPRRIDLVAASLDGKAKEHVRGVYGLRGDELSVCLAADDEPRPANTYASPGSEEVSAVLRRQLAQPNAAVSHVHRPADRQRAGQSRVFRAL